MPSYEHPFYFDVNYSFLKEGVFTLVDHLAGSPVPPPIEGYFLLTDNTPMLLTDSGKLLLA